MQLRTPVNKKLLYLHFNFIKNGIKFKFSKIFFLKTFIKILFVIRIIRHLFVYKMILFLFFLKKAINQYTVITDDVIFSPVSLPLLIKIET